VIDDSVHHCECRKVLQDRRVYFEGYPVDRFSEVSNARITHNGI
jgi:hypothetical protein